MHWLSESVFVFHRGMSVQRSHLTPSLWIVFLIIPYILVWSQGAWVEAETMKGVIHLRNSSVSLGSLTSGTSWKWWLFFTVLGRQTYQSISLCWSEAVQPFFVPLLQLGFQEEDVKLHMLVCPGIIRGTTREVTVPATGWLMVLSRLSTHCGLLLIFILSVSQNLAFFFFLPKDLSFGVRTNLFWPCLESRSQRNWNQIETSFNFSVFLKLPSQLRSKQVRPHWGKLVFGPQLLSADWKRGRVGWGENQHWRVNPQQPLSSCSLVSTLLA